MSEKNHDRALWALTAGNFVIGTGVLAPAGLINDLKTAFSVDAATIGSLIGYGAIVLCVGAPLSAIVTNGLGRRALLAGSLWLYAIGHALSTFAESFEALLAIRLIMIISAAVFTPQAASAIGLFMPAERRASAVSFVFLGWSLAAAFGLPLTGLIGDRAGWPAAYAVLAVACVLAALAVMATIPARLRGPALSLAAWGRVTTNAGLLLTLAVTALSLTGQFVVFPFVAADLRMRLGAEPETIAVFLSVFGIAGAIGGILATAAIGRFGAASVLHVCLAAMGAGLALWSAGGGAAWILGIGLFVWGLGFSAANSSQQARLIGTAPALASASVSLNTSMIYVGQAAGTALGAAMLSGGAAEAMGWAGAGVIVVAAVLSFTARRTFRV